MLAGGRGELRREQPVVGWEGRERAILLMHDLQKLIKGLPCARCLRIYSWLYLTLPRLPATLQWSQLASGWGLLPHCLLV